MGSEGSRLEAKLQALVYDILPSTMLGVWLEAFMNEESQVRGNFYNITFICSSQETM